MSSSSGARFSLLVVPLLFFGCFTAGEDSNDEDDDEPRGCRVDTDCREGRVCVDVDGDLDGVCEGDEDCACGPAGSGGSGNSNGGSAGNATGGSSEGGGGSGTGGDANGGSTTGGSATGGNATGGSSTGGSSGACGAYCDRIALAMCAATDRNACVTGCDSFSADCPAEAAPMLSCIANPANQVSCMSGAPVIQGCDAELEAMDRCFICVPETADMQCLSCTKASCCDEFGDYNLASDVQDFFDCVVACTTNECVDGCVSSFPVAGAAALALVDCQNTSCAEPCICEASTGDDACLACSKQSCCTELVDYSLASDLEAFEVCATPCEDELCLGDCADTYPVAGNAFLAWSDCAYQNCTTECQ